MPCAELSDIRCYYELLGDGEPLLLIPGLGGTLRLWDPVAPELAQRFSCSITDNRGMGRSIARRSPGYLRDYVSDLVELLDYLQLDRAHVLGVSLGGVIAQHLAIDHPSRVDRLVVVSSSNFFTPYLKQMALLLAQGLRHFKKEDFVRMMELLATSPKFHDDNAELVEQRVKFKTSNVSRGSLATQLRCLACSDKTPEQYRIDAPTLVIGGEFDPIIPSCYSKSMASMIPDSRFELIDGAGHNPLIDDAQRVVPMIVDFLSERDANRDDWGRSECVAAGRGEEG